MKDTRYMQPSVPEPEDNFVQNLVKLMCLVFLIFLVLKLSGGIDWSWWWVTSPLWGPPALGLLVGFLDLL